MICNFLILFPDKIEILKTPVKKKYFRETKNNMYKNKSDLNIH